MIGKTLGHYQITEKLGEGGMGVVYKARDTHLDRFAAIKVLPPEKVSDPDRKRRFIQEAKAASALNHPNIITIHDIDQADGIDYIAMEYVAGKTLDQRIGHRGLRLNDALKYAVQIADALSKAHSAGIVHRDLKPTNIMVNEDGVVKVLDFGLAKLTEQIQGDETASTATVDSEGRPITEEGVIVGTVAYMSPEQAEGKKVDARSDIFSMGSVLYEMVTGQKAFQGTSRMSTLSAILHQEPKPVSGITPAIPADLEKLINRCLRKDPSKRLQHMDDMKLALDELKEDSDSGRLQAEPAAAMQVASKRLVIGAVALAAMIVLALAGWYWLGRRHSAEPEVPLIAVPLTSYPGSESEPSFSPDGSQIAFSWDGVKEDNFDIYVKLIGTEPPLRLTTNPASERSPAWSPDNRWIAFCHDLSGGRYAVALISPIGGPERILVEQYYRANNFADAPYLAWSPDSRSLAVAGAEEPDETGGVFLYSLETGKRWKLTFPPVGSPDACPAFSPDGRTLAFSRWASWSNSDLFLLDLSQDFKPIGEPKRLTFGNWRAEFPAWTADGKSLVFSASGSLWRVEASGESKPQRLATIGADGSCLTISWRGHRLAYAHEISDENIYRIELPSAHGKANPPQKFIASTRREYFPQFSPEGKKIAFVSERSGSPEVWVCDAEGSNSVQLTFLGGPAIGSPPRWSPDSRRLTFDASIEAHPEVYVISASGGNPQRLTSTSAGSQNPSWTRDGRFILFDLVDSSTPKANGIFKVPAEGGPAVLITNKGGYGPIESPDGKFIYGIGESTDGLILSRSPMEGGEPTQVLGSLLNFPGFAVVEDGIYFMPRQDSKLGYSIQFLNTTTATVQRIASVEKPGWPGLAVSPDRQRILYSQVDQSGSDLMLVENFR